MTDPGAQTSRITPGYGPSPRADAALPLRQRIFECVRSAGQIPRVDVAKQLDVSPASVTTLVSELLRDGLLSEVATPLKPSPRGRPPVALEVDGPAGYVIGIKLSDATHNGVIVDMAGQPVANAELNRPAPRADLATLIDQAEALINQLIADSGLDRGRILALGLGLPGVVDHAKGIVQWSPIVRGQGLPLAQMLSDRLNLPVQIDNDANLATLAELWYGAGRSRSDFAVVTIEHGVGMGLVVDGSLYRGANGLGMELGHTKVQLDGALCRCGQRGCLEAYVADYALVREASIALDLHREKADTTAVLLESLYEQAKAGNEAARMIFRRAGRVLALGLSNVVNLFDPSLIVLSGERMRYDYLYAEDVLRTMEALALDTGRPPSAVEINARGTLVWARGAATLALDAVTAQLTNRAAS